MKNNKDYSIKNILNVMHKGGPGFFVVFQYPIALLAWCLVRTKVHPCGITILNFFLKILNAIFLCFCLENYLLLVLAVCGMYLSECLDYSDGCIARLKNKTSDFGAWLDGVVEDYAFIYYFFGIAIALYRFNGASWPLIMLSITITLKWFQQEWMRRFMAEIIKKPKNQIEVFKTAEAIVKKFNISWRTLAIGNDTHTMGLIVLILFRRLDLILYLFSFYHASILCYVIFRAFKMGKEENLKNY